MLPTQSLCTLKLGKIEEKTGGVSYTHWYLPLLYTKLFSRPGRRQGQLYKHLCYSSIDSSILQLKYLYGAIIPKWFKMVLLVIKQIILTFISDILNSEGHHNSCVGSKVMAILINGWILPTGGAASGRVCACRLRSRLVQIYPSFDNCKRPN